MQICIRDFDFQGNTIRCVGTDRDPWFVAKDVAEALGITWRGSATLDCLPAEWIGVRNLRTPMRQRDGQYRDAAVEVIVINESALYKLAFRSNKPAADAFTNWVASEVLPAIRKTGQYVSARRARYERQGKQLEWIDNREEGIEVRKGFTNTLKDHGVEKGGYPACTDAINRPVLGGTAVAVKSLRGLKQKANLRDSLSTIELAKVKLAELMAAERIEKEKACKLSGQAVAAAAQIASDGQLS